MIRIIKKELTKEVEIKEKFLKYTWIKVVNPSEEETQALQDSLKLEEDLLKDALDIYEIPRFEMYEGVLYMYARFAYSEHNQIATSPILITLSPSHIVTYSRKSFQGFEKFLTGKIEFSTKDTATLFLKIVDQILESYSHYLIRISKQVYHSEYKLEKIRNHDITQFVIYERVLNNFHFALTRIHTILQNLTAKKLLKQNEDQEDYLEDIILKNAQLIEISRTSIKSIVNIREAYSTIMTNNLNNVIKLFTAITIILTVPTIISSIYGMNVPLPFQNGEYTFEAILAVIIGISSLGIIIFNVNDWL
jgi:magnesium transporter